LLFENFLRYREGEATDWGPNTFIKTGLDGRHWLVSNIEGPHPVGRRMQLPGEFALECRYTTYLPEVTRGLLGWWKEPVASRITLMNDQGAKYTIQWVIQCGSDPTRLNPLGSPTLLARKYFHTFVLPDGSANEIESLQPTGRLRIERNADAVQILLDGRPALAGAIASRRQRPKRDAVLYGIQDQPLGVSENVSTTSSSRRRISSRRFGSRILRHWLSVT
jgi:hypothetical protein